MKEPATYHATAGSVHQIVGRPDWPPIETEIARRGVRLKRVGHELIGPCPVCGGVDRFAVHVAKQIWNCRGCVKGGDVVDLVQHVDNVNFVTAVATLTGEKPHTTAKPSNGHNGGGPCEGRDYERRQHAKAAWLWSRHQPIAGTIAEKYLREARGIPCALPATLGFLPAHTPARHPAMIAAFGIAEEHVDAVHLTLLKADGSGKAEAAKPKLFVGRPLGRPIVLAPIGDTLTLAVTEGIEDGLSVRAALDMGVWAAGSGDRLPMLADAVPRYVETVTIWSHPDPAGQNGARKLAELLHRRGVEVFVEGLLARSLTDYEIIALVGGNR